MTKRWLACVLCAVLWSTSAAAQDEATKAQAREQFNQGIAQYEASDYERALESFQEAYRLSPHPMVRVNMANCYDRLGKPVEAMFHFERFLSETEGDRSRATQRAEVQGAIARLKRSMAELSLRVIPDGSLVRVDEAEERRSPIMEPIRLAQGDHVIVVSRPGFNTVERRIQLRGGSRETLDITLERAPAVAVVVPATEPGPATEGPTPRPVIAPLSDDELAQEASSEPIAQTEAPPPSTPRIPEGPAREPSGMWTPPVVIASVVSGTFLLGGTLMGLMAMKANADFEGYEAQSRNPALSMRDQEAARKAAIPAGERASDRALAADIMFAGALISGAAAVVLVLTQDDDEASDMALRLSPGAAVFRARF